MRQGENFATHFELVPYDKHETVKRFFSDKLVQIDISISNRSAEFDIPANLVTLKVVMSASVRQNSTFYPPLDAPRSLLSSAFRISAVRQTYDRIANFL